MANRTTLHTLKIGIHNLFSNKWKVSNGLQLHGNALADKGIEFCGMANGPTLHTLKLAIHKSCSESGWEVLKSTLRQRQRAKSIAKTRHGNIGLFTNFTTH